MGSLALTGTLTETILIALREHSTACTVSLMNKAKTAEIVDVGLRALHHTLVGVDYLERGALHAKLESACVLHAVSDVLQRYPQNPATLDVGRDLRRLLLLDYTAPQLSLELMYSNSNANNSNSKFKQLSQKSTIVIPSFQRALVPCEDDGVDEMSSPDYNQDYEEGEQRDRMRGSSMQGEAEFEYDEGDHQNGAAAEIEPSQLAAWRASYSLNGTIPAAMKQYCKQHGIGKGAARAILSDSVGSGRDRWAQEGVVAAVVTSKGVVVHQHRPREASPESCMGLVDVMASSPSDYHPDDDAGHGMPPLEMTWEDEIRAALNEGVQGGDWNPCPLFSKRAGELPSESLSMGCAAANLEEPVGSCCDAGGNAAVALSCDDGRDEDDALVDWLDGYLQEA